MKVSKKELYKRQTILPDIGELGQKRMLEAKVAVIGCGGLGGTVAVHLAASGIGRIHLIDYDEISLSNLHRQVFFKVRDVGKKKSRVLAEYLSEISPFVKESYSEEPLNKSNINRQLEGFDLIVDCTDSLITKYLINDHCVLNEKTLVYGSLYKHDGYVSSFNLRQGERLSANLRDAFPEIPQMEIPNCSEIGTLNPIVGIIALMQANEVIKIVTNSGVPLANKLLIYNSMQNTQFTMGLKSEVNKKAIEVIYKRENYLDKRCEIQDEKLIISAEKLKATMSQVEILSVIDDLNIPHPFVVHQQIPFLQFNMDKLIMPSEKDLVVICKKGISSYEITQRIKLTYPKRKVLSLIGGIEKFQDEL